MVYPRGADFIPNLAPRTVAAHSRYLTPQCMNELDAVLTESGTFKECAFDPQQCFVLSAESSAALFYLPVSCSVKMAIYKLTHVLKVGAAQKRELL